MNHLNATLRVSVVSSALLGTAAEVVDDGESPQEVLLMPEWGFTVTAIILFFIGFFGFFFNLIVIVLMYKDVQVSASDSAPLLCRL